jgi:hypothetical protein
VSKSGKRNKSETVNTGQFMKTSNRYTPLTNVFVDNKGTYYCISVIVKRNISTKGSVKVDSGASQLPGTFRKPAPVKIKNTCFPKPRKNKISIIWDTHARGCAANLTSSLKESFEVVGSVMPGSRVEHITSLARSEISHQSRNDFVVIWGGTNDISKN